MWVYAREEYAYRPLYSVYDECPDIADSETPKEDAEAFVAVRVPSDSVCAWSLHDDALADAWRSRSQQGLSVATRSRRLSYR